jgi:CRISPR-associated protein Cas2
VTVRNRYLVCYDVSDPKRLERTYKKMTGFGEHVQYSVFVCDLSPTDRVRLEEALIEILNLKEDRVLIVDTGPTEGRGQECFKAIGRSSNLPERVSVIV